VGHAAIDGHVQLGHVGKAVGVIGVGVDGLAQVLAHLALYHVEGRGEFDIPDVIAAQIGVHQAGNEDAIRRIAVELNALHQRRGAVAHADDGHANLLRLRHAFLLRDGARMDGRRGGYAIIAPHPQ
jgi:hypothetical protein